MEIVIENDIWGICNLHIAFFKISLSSINRLYIRLIVLLRNIINKFERKKKYKVIYKIKYRK